MSTLTIAVTLVAAACFGAFILLGAWIDGRRQKLREKGLHPVTTSGGSVTAQEFLSKPPEEPSRASRSPGAHTPPTP